MIPKKPTREQLRLIVSDHLLQQYSRGRCELDPAVELDKLHHSMVESAKAYELGPRDQRQAVCDAVIAISDFLRGQGFSSVTLAPMNRIVAAFVDLSEQNRPDQLFCKKTNRTKARRSMQDALRQGHLAAFADAWIKSHPDDGSNEVRKLKLAARRMSGAYFGTLDDKALRNAKSYQRQTEQHELVYSSYDQMNKVLTAEANSAGGDKAGLRIALELQIDALNLRATLRKS